MRNYTKCNFEIIKTLTTAWYQARLNLLTILLLPLSYLFYFIIVIRRAWYKLRAKTIKRFPVPIIVVGNITIGGTGKTPLVIRLAQLFQSQNIRIGIVSRGYGVRAIRKPRIVLGTDTFDLVGDETVLMRRHLNCPIVVCANRVLAVETLLAHYACDVVISDDGLQHYVLHRDIEIAVVDGERLFGNRQLLPAGPLREPLSRLRSVDFIMCQGECEIMGANAMVLKPNSLISVCDLTRCLDFDTLRHDWVHAVAGIGNPARFFDLLRQLNFNIVEHAYPDHYVFKKTDLYFGDDNLVVMTEKDAVKCQQFSNHHAWFLSVEAVLSNEFEKQLILLLRSLWGKK